MSDSEWVTGRVGLRVGNVPLDLEMTVPAAPVKPHRMLPIFQQMADSFAEIGVRTEIDAGEAVSCKPKCTACCHQAIPVSETELYYIAELVDSLPEPRRTETRRRFAEAVKHFRKIGWFDELHSSGSGSLKWAEKLVLKYFFERVPCPFLDDEMCSIYSQRPIACREYLVTSPAENCSTPSAGGVKLVQMPVKPSRAMKHIVAGEAAIREGFLLLIMSLEIAQRYPETFPEKTGEQWMADFFASLTRGEDPPERPRPESTKSLRKRRKRHLAKR